MRKDKSAVIFIVFFNSKTNLSAQLWGKGTSKPDHGACIQSYAPQLIKVMIDLL